MSDRLLRVNAYTTLDLVDARVWGHDFETTTLGVVNVSTPRETPDHIDLQVELDGTDVESLPAHADEMTLSADQARTLAAALESAADRVDDAGNADDA